MFLISHPGVKEAGVCGQDHPEWGSVPVAFIVGDEHLTTVELEEYCKGQLGSYKIPKAFHFVEELPRNASNKLLRRELKEWAVKLNNEQIERDQLGPALFFTC